MPSTQRLSHTMQTNSLASESLSRGAAGGGPTTQAARRAGRRKFWLKASPGTGLKGAANEVIDLVPLFETFDLMTPAD